jgi:alpha-glucosidase
MALLDAKLSALATTSALVAGLALAAPSCAEPDGPAAAHDSVAQADTATAASCFVDDASELAAAAPGALAAGDFTVAVAADGRVDVRHARDPGRSVFASAAGAPFTAARVATTATDRQGSFTFSETKESECAAPRLDDVRQGRGVVALRGGFADADAACAPLRWEMQLCPSAAGHLAFRVTTSDARFNRITLRAASDAGERIYGLGEQLAHDRLDLKGRILPVLAQEGGVGRGHTPITQAVNLASPGAGGSEDSTYYAAPHYLTSRLRSLFLENTEVATFDFRAADTTEVRVYAPSMVGHILFGSTPLDLIARFTDYAGRMPALPDWVNQGAIVALAQDAAHSQKIVDDLRAHGAEIGGVWNQTWSGRVTTYIGQQVLWNWVQDPGYFTGWQGFVDALDQRGIKTLCYLNPMLVDPAANGATVSRNLYAEALAAGYFVKNASGAPYLMKETAFTVGMLDLTSPQARDWMKSVIKTEVLGNARCSGWMVDFGEALPFDAVLASGVPAATFHNQYPVEWMRLNREAIEEAGRLSAVLTFNRSGSTRTPAYSQLVWEGDQLTTWDKYDGLVSALHGLVGGGFSGIALNHSDTGGYTSLSVKGIGYTREAELLKRWTEMNAFTAVLRTHEGNQPATNAQIYSDDAALDHFARFTKVYKALAFYRTQLFQDARERGWPLVRHLWLQYPDDARAQTVDDEFLLGSEILVAPVENKCFTRPFCPYDKAVYLPRGEWVHLWTGAVYGSAADGTGGSGGSNVSVKAPIGQPAVFYRRGSVVGATFVANLRTAGIAVGGASR